MDTDGYNITDCESAKVVFTRWMKKAIDADEDIELEIVESKDMDFVEETKEQQDERLAEEERQAKVDETMKWLYG